MQSAEDDLYPPGEGGGGGGVLSFRPLTVHHHLTPVENCLFVVSKRGQVSWINIFSHNNTGRLASVPWGKSLHERLYLTHPPTHASSLSKKTNNQQTKPPTHRTNQPTDHPTDKPTDAYPMLHSSTSQIDACIPSQPAFLPPPPHLPLERLQMLTLPGALNLYLIKISRPFVPWDCPRHRFRPCWC